MRRRVSHGIVLAALTLSIGVHSPAIGQSVLSVCDYTPPESRLERLSLQGSFQWYDGPFADDRTRTVSLVAAADYGALISSEPYGRRLDLYAEARTAANAWSLDLRGDGDLKAFLDGDVFGLGAFGVDASLESLEVDLTAGVGSGRFRDVTPLAKAIRLQNALLDLGTLLAPLDRGQLLTIARTLGEVGPTDEERVVGVSDQLVAAGLLRDGGLDVLALLAIEETIASSEGGRLCGSDVQARVGLAAMVLPELSIATTGALLYNAAFVPDPVSQLLSDASVKVRLAHLGELGAELNASYLRRLPDGWTARLAYRFVLDRGWSRPDRTTVDHDLTASLTTQLFGAIGLSLAGEVRYGSGDEELTSSLTVHLAYDLF